jgi:hypothetical protein
MRKKKRSPVKLVMLSKRIFKSAKKPKKQLQLFLKNKRRLTERRLKEMPPMEIAFQIRLTKKMAIPTLKVIFILLF